MTTPNAKGAPSILVEDGDTSISIQPRARLDLYSTFRVGGPADYLVRAGDEREASLALAWAAQRDLPVTVFGGGSNMLVSDRGIRGLVLVVRRSGRDVGSEIQIHEETPESVTVTVPASAPLTWLGREASRRGWTGLTWAVGLPGNVGGATVNNAGAHGTEMKDNLVRLRLVEGDGTVVERDREWLSPEYRMTRLKARGNPKQDVVIDVTLQLGRADAAILQAEAEEHADYRRRTQPTGKCAGSIFKNPPDAFSGQLIEELGLKGTRVGGAEVSPKHANFIVNEDGATASDIIELIQLVQLRVKEATGIELQTEIERVGEWD
ncbi:UDP-N-acetylmuramate dehydrogenase [soil metagenome]